MLVGNLQERWPSRPCSAALVKGGEMFQFRSTTAGKLAILTVVAGLLMPLAATAQDASPAVGEIVQPKTKVQNQEELKAAFAATDEPAQNPDGSYVIGSVGDLQSTNP